MFAKQCDICGGFFVPYREPSRRDTILIFNSAAGYKTTWKTSGNTYNLQGAKKYDVCDACVHSFEALLRDLQKDFDPSGNAMIAEKNISIDGNPQEEEAYQSCDCEEGEDDE